jgi:choline dehydrogenase-like flavoprotein
VGAGAAGLALASQFLGTPWRVVVLESGLREPDAIGDDLNSLLSVGLRHDGGRDGRVRAFGGTTRAWGGQLVPLRASELAARSWVPESGWPLEHEELQPYYRRVERLLQTEGPPYDELMWSRLGIEPPGFDPADFSVRFSQWAALGRRNFAVLWRRDLERAPNITVMLDATVVAVRCGESGEHCESVEVCSRDGYRASVRARSFVVACGGIETARLLLASPGTQGAGVANRSGLVGRFFQDHISYRAGHIEPASRRAVQNLFDPRYVGGTMYSVKLEPSDAAMRRNRWLNVMAHVAFQIPDALGWMELKRILRSMQAGKLAIPSLDEALAMARGSIELTRLIMTRVWAKRRRSPDEGEIMLLLDTEQAPNAQSRVALDGSADAFGIPRVRLDWRITELEYRTLTEFGSRVAAEFARMKLGTVHLAQRPDFELRDAPGAARDIFHHMGTTRMSQVAGSGVTRPDLRCHEVDNLFIAGPSVFPSGGIANPTFTVLALTLRLADHLKRVYPV